MSKNAISILQEYLQISRCPLPKYDLIKSDLSSFAYKVSCNINGRPFSTTGESTNKQTAKKYAAENLIIILITNNYKISYQPEDATGSPDGNSPSSPLGEINYIGKLQEQCVKNGYVVPCYSEGAYIQGHSFTMTCTLGTYQVEGMSNGKKKQAKYACAKKMLEDLRGMTKEQIAQHNILNGLSISKPGNNLPDIKAYSSRELSIGSAAKTKQMIEKAIQLFPKLTKSHILTTDTTKIKLSMYHTYFKSSFDKSQLMKFYEFYQLLNLQQIQNDIGKLVKALDEICKILNITKQESVIKTVDNQNYAVEIKLSTTPEFSDIGLADNFADAKRSAYYRIIRTIFFLLM